MESRSALKLAMMLALGSALSAVPAAAQQHRIDTEHSILKIFVYKSGLFSVFAHNHVIEAPLAGGEANIGEAPSVSLRIETRALRVLDPEVSEKDRAEIQQTMLGPKVLDAERFPEIGFESTEAERTGQGTWNVRGKLTLHGQTRAVSVEVTQDEASYRGTTTLRQRDFGITPVSIAGGTVKVKDAVKIEFEIRLQP